MIASDHYFNKADLKGISTRVQNGQPLHFDPKQVQEFVATMATLKPGKRVGSFVIGLFIFVIATIVGGIYVLAKFILR